MSLSKPLAETMVNTRLTSENSEDYVARRNASDFGIAMINNAQCAKLFGMSVFIEILPELTDFWHSVEAMARKIPEGGLEKYSPTRPIPTEVKAWSQWVGGHV